MDEIESKARHSLLHFLSFRPRSTKEAVEFLLKKEYEADLIDSLINEFTQDKLIDDLQFASWWTDSRVNAADTGPRLIEAQLRAKGVSSEVISQSLKRDWPEITLTALKRQLQRGHVANPSRETKQKVINTLLRRGFLHQHLLRAFDALG